MAMKNGFHWVKKNTFFNRWKRDQVHSGHVFFFGHEWFFCRSSQMSRKLKTKHTNRNYGTTSRCKFPPVSLWEILFVDLLVKVLGLCSKGVLKPTLEERIFVDLFLDLHGFLTNSREKGNNTSLEWGKI